jgi:hypothetical protein
MKNLYRIFIMLVILSFNSVLFAGNRDRVGEAGASELLINPWAASSGWGGVNVAGTRGVESFYNNVAGLAFVNQFEATVSHSQWLSGANINLYNAGFATKLGDEGGVLGVNVMSLNFGDISRTTVYTPEGDGSTFSPRYMVIGVSFSKEFSNSIYAGAQMKIINESISNAGANGVAFDAGIQYVTGDDENIHFGITLKNIGPKLMFTGDGFSTKVATLEGIDGEYTLLQRGTSFELPTQLIIGGAYDLLVQRFKVTFAGSFVSNSFSRDQMIGGLEFSYNNMLFLRGGYTYESDVMNSEISTALNGPSAGLSVRVPLSKETKSGFTVDFSYRSTVNFSSIYTFGIGISF